MVDLNLAITVVKVLFFNTTSRFPETRSEKQKQSTVRAYSSSKQLLPFPYHVRGILLIEYLKTHALLCTVHLAEAPAIYHRGPTPGTPALTVTPGGTVWARVAAEWLTPYLFTLVSVSTPW